MVKKNNFKNEINLADVIFMIWTERKTILITTVLAILLAFVYIKSKDPVEPVFRATTEIRPISSFDEFEYEAYNNFIQNKNFEISLNSNLKVIDFNYKKIDRTYLINLFIEKLSEDNFLSNLIKKSELLNKNDFNNVQEYENAIFNLKSKINFIPIINNDWKKDNWEINFITKDKKKWENFLRLAEKTTNMEIQNFLIKKFKYSILNEEQLIDFKIKDIDLRLNSEIDNDVMKNSLRNEKKLLEKDENIQRLKIIFKSTPVISSTGFFAARTMISSTKYRKKTKEINQNLILLVGAILGALFGILYSLIFSRSLKK